MHIGKADHAKAKRLDLLYRRGYSLVMLFDSCPCRKASLPSRNIPAAFQAFFAFSLDVLH
jgi:hypothetical protein